MTDGSGQRPPAGAGTSRGPAPAGKTDGRKLRSENTRSAVAGAYLDLLEAGDPRPTARAIADRAGVSERAVFRHFQDMETLLRETGEIQIRRVTADLPPPASADGPAAGRAAAVALRWCTVHEKVAPVRRIALLHEPFSPEIARRLAWARLTAQQEIETAFAAELAARDEETRRRAVAALAAAASWETWNELRSRHGLEQEAATATVAAMLLAVAAMRLDD